MHISSNSRILCFVCKWHIVNYVVTHNADICEMQNVPEIREELLQQSQKCLMSPKLLIIFYMLYVALGFVVAELIKLLLLEQLEVYITVT